MQRFEFRGPRFPVSLPVQLTVQNSTLSGRCTEISKEGMKLEVGQPLQPNSTGTVSMNCAGRVLEFPVRIVHVKAKQAGLEFIPSSDAESNAVAHLVESSATPQNRRGPVLLKRR